MNIGLTFYPAFVPENWFQVSGVRKGRRNSISSYETTPKWHSLMMIRLAVSMVWINQQTADYRMTKDGIASRNLFLNRQDKFIRRSMLSVRCSVFISFFYDRTGRFSGQRQR
jgi:hypothetical protein